MTPRTTEIGIATDRGELPAFLLEPDRADAGIVLVPTVFGLDDEMKHIAAAYAQHGYNVLVPDLFWPDAPGPLRHDDPDQRAAALKRYESFDVEWGVAAVKASGAFLVRLSDRAKKFAVVGYCFGGRYAFLGAARCGASAAVSFHGTRIGLDLAEADAVTCPVSFHFGEADPSIPPEEVAAISAALAFNSAAEIVSYANAKHGFTQPSRPAYDPDATQRSFERALAALDTLRPTPVR